VSTAEGYGGRLITTLRPALTLASVQREGDRYRASVEPPGSGASIEFEWTLQDDALTGQWTGFGQTGPLEGTRVPTDADGNLEPVPCAAPGVRGLAKCAVFHVWEDREAQAGRKIPINIVIVPARSEDPEPDPLVHFAGGPGQASTDQSGGNQYRYSAINERRDIVMVDQRGTGASNGLRCDLGVESLLTWQFSPEEVAACREQLESRADLALYHSAVAADDLDEVREWLGYPSLNLYGGSYGTRAALVYLRRHPDRVRTVTVRGIMPPNGQFPLNNPQDAQVSLENVLARCGAGSDCGDAFPDLPARFRLALDRLDADPVYVRLLDPISRDSIDYPIGRAAFAWAIRRVLMSSDLHPLLPALITQAGEGDLSGIRPGLAGTLGVTESMYMGMGLSVMCTEEADRIARADIEAETEGTFIGDGPIRTMLAACGGWPRGELPVGFHDPVRSDAPVLLLSGETDPTTPARWGALAAETLPNGLHLVMPGVSHGPFPDCAIEIMAAMVETGTTEGLDTSCVAEIPVPGFDLPGS
jgi:pimeloyl-ACP methyl ester carboxylesterase